MSILSGLGQALYQSLRSPTEYNPPVNRSSHTVAAGGGGDAAVRPGLDGGPAWGQPTQFYPMLGDNSWPHGRTGNRPGAPELVMVPIPTAWGRPTANGTFRNVFAGSRAAAFAEARTNGRTLTPPINQSGR